MALAYWSNGEAVSAEQAIEILMAYFGEGREAARMDLWAITREGLTDAVRWYERQ